LSFQDPSKKKAEEAERAKRLAPKPKPKYDTKTGKWVVMNWDGTVAGVEGGDQINFKDMTRQVSALTEPTMGSDRSSLHDPASPRDGPHLFPPVPFNDNDAPLRPFARVNAVAADSPAQGAGLKEDDLIVRFGHLDADNHDHLKAIAALVPEVAGEGGDVKIEILRRPREYNEEHASNQGASNATVTGSLPEYNDPAKWDRITVSLTPRPWSGRGLIGKTIIVERMIL
jgi:hypothetical protein